MADLMFIVITVAFFAVAAALVIACDRIIGPDDAAPASADPAVDATPRAQQ